MALVIKISRNDRQWTAHVPKAKGLVAWSSSLKRLRGHVNGALKEFYPELAELERREVIDLPKETRAILKGLAKAEKDVDRAARRAAVLRQQASRRLQTKLQISVREVGDLMGLSGSRAHQLLRERKSS
jgi:hypothetical protein